MKLNISRCVATYKSIEIEHLVVWCAISIGQNNEFNLCFVIDCCQVYFGRDMTKKKNSINVYLIVVVFLCVIASVIVEDQIADQWLLCNSILYIPKIIKHFEKCTSNEPKKNITVTLMRK